MKRLLFTLIFVALTSCSGSETATLPTTPTDIPLEWIRIENRRTERELFTNNLIPLENCNGNRPVSLSFNRSQSTTTTTEFSIGGELEAGIREIATVKIQAEYNVQNGETVSASQEYQVEVEEGTRVDYEINWYETWQAGEIVIDQLGLRFQFRVRTGLEGELSSGAPQLCPMTETLTNTPSDTPISTFTPTDTLTYTPTATDVPPTDTPPPTDTNVPTATFTDVPTDAPTATQTATTAPTQTEVPTTADVPIEAYPCEGQTVFRSSALLNVVRANPSAGAPLRNPVAQGITVSILAKVENTRFDVWYQIADADEVLLGWIPVEYVTPSQFCPN